MGMRFFNRFRAKSLTRKTAKCHYAVKCPIYKRTSSLDTVKVEFGQSRLSHSCKIKNKKNKLDKCDKEK